MEGKSVKATTKKGLLVAALLLAGAPGPAGAQSLGLVATPGDTGDWGAMAHANGDKVVIGRFNTLHAVWQAENSIRYATSVSGEGGSWTAAAAVAPGLPGAMPAIASDTDGTLVVAFVANPNASGVGQIRYARKAWGAAGWSSPVEVVIAGTQPDIEARGGRVYLTWTSLGRVQFTSFPIDAPPAPLSVGEVIEGSSCANTRFLWPSLALVRESCQLVPKVAYLRQIDERNNANLACYSPTTQVGPRVRARNPSTGVWTQEFTDTVAASFPATGVSAVSLSLNAQYTSGHTFLAWSDTSNGNARARLAHGQNGLWSAVTLEPTPLHTHVAVKPDSPMGDYRLAWVKRDGIHAPTFLFLDFDAAFRTGRWTSGPSPTWLDPLPTILMGNSGASAGHPQATYWSRCFDHSLTTVQALAVTSLEFITPAIQEHYVDQQPCPAGSTVGVNPCLVRLSALVFSSRAKTHVDTSELGVPLRFGRGWAEIALSQGGKEGRATLTWDGGEVIESGPDYFVIDQPGVRLEIAEATHRVELVRLADNYDYDELVREP